MEVGKGLRVVRGPAWSWGDQDGGEGYVGTVVDTQSATTDRQGESETRAVIVTVQWDRGNRCRYRCGVDDKYDLRVFESSPVVPPHPHVSCDGCSQEDAMAGMRWKCARCYDYDLCTPCYMGGKHSVEHEFVRFDTVHIRTRVPPRHSARKVEARGIFPGAEVVRSHEWSQGDHNSGVEKPGKVIHVEGWEDESYRSAVQVEWQLTHQKSKCRVGHEGKVDLKCTAPATGGDYYPEHLPVLGAPLMPPNPQEFSCGDYVKVELDLDVLRLMQFGHGGWNEDMAAIRGQLGVIHHVLDNGDLSVVYGDRTWTVNPVAIVKVDVPQYARGDVVHIMDDMAEVRKLQQGHGEWNEDMVTTVGQLGVVQGVNNGGNALVIVKGRLWIFNPLCLSAAPNEKVSDVQNTVLGEDATLLRMSMLSLIENEDSDFLVHAALLGEESAIRDYLQKYPNEVNAQFLGKAPIHCAAAAGRVSVVKMLLEFQANLEIEDEDGLRPLHHCAIRKEAEAAKVLLDAGADPNSKSHDGSTAITIAAMKGSNDVLALLAKHPKIDLRAQDSDGDTALHCAVHTKKQQAVKILLEAGADPALVNFQLITPVHLAANLGFVLAVEEFITCFPQHLNLRDDEGLTPLHVAAIANHCDIVSYLAEQKCCEIDSRTMAKYTPLHLASMRGNSRIVECLVGYGASLNAADCDEDTALHLILNKKEVDAPSSETPELKKVQEALDQQDGVIHPGIIVACFFVQEGADIHLTNKKGLTPLQVCSESPEVVAKVLEFAEKCTGTGTFRGSLHSSATKSPTSGQPTSTNDCNSQAVQTKQVEPKEKQPTCVARSSESCPTEVSQLSPPLTDSASTHAVASAVKPSPVKQGQKYRQNETAHTQTDRAELCFLCDTPITVKFQPCEHSVVCEDCARRASKCPHCKTPIQAVIRLQ